MVTLNEQNKININVENYFATQIFYCDASSYLNIVNNVADDFLNKTKKTEELNEIWPVYMTENIYNDLRIKDFVSFIGNTAWDILKSQGYNMQNKNVSFTEMWIQEHHKTSSMEQHSHGRGAQIVGFYCLNGEEGHPRILFHDPRLLKTQIELSQENETIVSNASNLINFMPKPGMLIFTNSWLAHSFSRNSSNKPFKFIHFNIVVNDLESISQQCEAEII